MPVPEPPPEGNTGPRAVARQIIDNIRGLFEDAGTAKERRDIITDELARTYSRMRLRLDRFDRLFVVAGGPEAREYQQVATLIAAALQKAGVPSRAARTDGSIENVSLLAGRLADVAFVQSNIAVRAQEGQAPFDLRRRAGCGRWRASFPSRCMWSSVAARGWRVSPISGASASMWACPTRARVLMRKRC